MEAKYSARLGGQLQDKSLSAGDLLSTKQWARLITAWPTAPRYNHATNTWKVVPWPYGPMGAWAITYVGVSFREGGVFTYQNYSSVCVRGVGGYSILYHTGIDRLVCTLSGSNAVALISRLHFSLSTSHHLAPTRAPSQTGFLVGRRSSYLNCLGHFHLRVLTRQVCSGQYQPKKRCS